MFMYTKNTSSCECQYQGLCQGTRGDEKCVTEIMVGWVGEDKNKDTGELNVVTVYV